MRWRRIAAALALSFVVALGAGCSDDVQRVGTKPLHVFIIVLENKGFNTTFGPSSPATYLSQTLTAQGQLLRQTQRAVAARDRAVSIVSHDLRDPLSTIQICANALLDPEPAPLSGVHAGESRS